MRNPVRVILARIVPNRYLPLGVSCRHRGIVPPTGSHQSRLSGFVITSDGAVAKLLGLFDEPILGNGAPESLANASYPSCHRGIQLPRQALSTPGLLGDKGGD